MTLMLARTIPVLLILLFTCTRLYAQMESVKIGNQVWMKMNLNVDKFRNGDPIPEVRDAAAWQAAGEAKKPAWSYYENDPANGAKYGKLYNWYTVTDPRGLCPSGWHVPSDAEWTVLTEHLGGRQSAGMKMKSTSGWEPDEGKSGNGSNESGFSGLPGGYRDYFGNFSYIGRFGFWWSSSEYSTHVAWPRGLNHLDGSVYRNFYGKHFGFSVRCLRD